MFELFMYKSYIKEEPLPRLTRSLINKISKCLLALLFNFKFKIGRIMAEEQAAYEA